MEVMLSLLMLRQSAGILLYKKTDKGAEIFLCHPGGPFYKNKDAGAWTIPKGEFNSDEEPLDAAKREFREETGQEISGEFISLRPVKYKDGRKIVYAWAIEGEIDTSVIKSNSFPLEWPPKSGKYIDVPEVDRGEWFTIEIAKRKILPSLTPLLNDFIENIVKQKL
jgi:predicted NUDIX family NTP pyrophosphohydrolase